jgi:hypothetical protein
MTLPRFALFFLVSFTACGRPPELPWAAVSILERAPDAPIVVIGDTQRTLWEEEVFSGREQNESARRGLIEKIRAERPAFVAHLGDMVAWGGSGAEWNYFDRLVSPLTASGIAILPALGNHEGYGDQPTARLNLERRFPELREQGYYARRFRGLGLIWLDTNLSGRKAKRQADWFGESVDALERDAEVRGIVVFTHHPPHTDAIQRRGSRYVLEEILPCFFAAPKALLMLSGHVHGYERFEARGKQLIVSGGGGGARVGFLPTESPGFRRLHEPGPGVSPFHYVVMRERAAGLEVSVPCLESGTGCRGGLLDRFSIGFRAQTVASDRRVCQLWQP